MSRYISTCTNEKRCARLWACMQAGRVISCCSVQQREERLVIPVLPLACFCLVVAFYSDCRASIAFSFCNRYVSRVPPADVTELKEKRSRHSGLYTIMQVLCDKALMIVLLHLHGSTKLLSYHMIYDSCFQKCDFALNI